MWHTVCILRTDLIRATGDIFHNAISLKYSSMAFHNLIFFIIYLILDLLSYMFFSHALFATYIIFIYLIAFQ